MPTRLDSNLPHRRFAEDIVRQLVEQHHIAYFAGGCVRDDLLGIPPVDFDIATSATPQQVQAIFGTHRTLLVGAAFGVVCVHQRIEGVLYQVEVATFRSDGVYSDGRRPDCVDFTTPELDAARRDFTINGLFYDPLTNRVIDFVDGQKDLECRLLRAIGNPYARFSEDKLRLLRAVRIAARFGLTIDIATRAAIIEMAADITAVSSERIAAEMQKMLDHPQRATAIRLLEEFRLLHAVFPEFGQSLANPETLQRTLNRLDAIVQPDFVACLSVLGMSHIESLASSEQAVAIKRLVRNLKSRWRLSNDNAVAIEFTLMNASAFFAAEHQPWSVLQPLLVSPYVDHALHFASAILRADFGTDRALDRCRESLKLSSAELNPVPLVDGQLLMSLGLPTSPLYARLIKLGRIAQLDGQIRTRDEAAEWARRQIS